MGKLSIAHRTHDILAQVTTEIVNLTPGYQAAQATGPPYPQASLQRPCVPRPILPRGVQERPCGQQDEQGEKHKEDEIHSSKPTMAKKGIARS